jgi:hypothetical protein
MERGRRMAVKIAKSKQEWNADEKTIHEGLKAIAKETGISMDELCLFGIREVFNHYNGIIIGKGYKSDLTEIFKKLLRKKKELNKTVKKTVKKMVKKTIREK